MPRRKHEREDEDNSDSSTSRGAGATPPCDEDSIDSVVSLLRITCMYMFASLCCFLPYKLVDHLSIYIICCFITNRLRIPRGGGAASATSLGTLTASLSRLARVQPSSCLGGCAPARGHRQGEPPLAWKARTLLLDHKCIHICIHISYICIYIYIHHIYHIYIYI